jgi:amphiphysin
MEELRGAVSPELELIESRIVGPVKELQGVLKMIRKTITKRDHKASILDLVVVVGLMEGALCS